MSHVDQDLSIEHLIFSTPCWITKYKIYASASMKTYYAASFTTLKRAHCVRTRHYLLADVSVWLQHGGQDQVFRVQKNTLRRNKVPWSNKSAFYGFLELSRSRWLWDNGVSLHGFQAVLSRRKLYQSHRRKIFASWQDKFWLADRDNAATHILLTTQQFFKKRDAYILPTSVFTGPSLLRRSAIVEAKEKKMFRDDRANKRKSMATLSASPIIEFGKFPDVWK